MFYFYSKMKELETEKIKESLFKGYSELSKYIPVICYDTPYNKECNGKNIIRAYSWYDIYRKLKEIEGKNGTRN